MDGNENMWVILRMVKENSDNSEKKREAGLDIYSEVGVINDKIVGTVEKSILLIEK